MSDDFIAALTALLKWRKIKVPTGLKDAPPEAYARQAGSIVEHLAKLDDAALLAQAQKIAGYAKRAADRAATEWERSPLVGEIRRRKLPEPPRPARVVGAVFAMKKPLSEWSDRELVEAATEWSKRGGGKGPIKKAKPAKPAKRKT